LWRSRERELIGRLRRKIKRTRQARLQKRLKALEKELPRGQRAGSDSTANRLVLAAVSDNFATVVALRQSIRRRVPQTIHRARVAFKRFRYMCELLSPILPGATKPVLDRMRDYQTRMGEIQDNEVLLAAFQSAIEQEGAPVAIAGGVRAALLRRRRCLIESYLATADELFDFDPAHLSRPVS
jgi:CHAD domain-containing protein